MKSSLLLFFHSHVSRAFCLYVHAAGLCPGAHVLLELCRMILTWTDHIIGNILVPEVDKSCTRISWQINLIPAPWRAPCGARHVISILNIYSGVDIWLITGFSLGVGTFNFPLAPLDRTESLFHLQKKGRFFASFCCQQYNVAMQNRPQLPQLTLLRHVRSGRLFGTGRAVITG